MSTVDELLNGSGAKPAAWNTPGTTHKGEITSVEVVQARDIKTNAPAFWNDGQPKEQIRVIIQTDERDDPEDDGLRSVYLKGGKFTKSVADGKVAKVSLEAVKDALKAAGARSIEVGATLAMQYVVDGERTQAGFNAPKLFLAAYKAAAPPAVDPSGLI